MNTPVQMIVAQMTSINTRFSTASIAVPRPRITAVKHVTISNIDFRCTKTIDDGNAKILVCVCPRDVLSKARLQLLQD